MVRMKIVTLFLHMYMFVDYGETCSLDVLRFIINCFISGILNIDNEIHIYCLHYVFLPRSIGVFTSLWPCGITTCRKFFTNTVVDDGMYTQITYTFK